MNDALTFGQGKIYVGSPDGPLHPLGEVEEIELIDACNEKDAVKVEQILSLHEQEATFTINLTQEQIKNLYDVVFKITKTVLSIVRGEGNARVCHLAKHGRKHRTRKKNVRRAIRIAERMTRNEQA